MTTPHTPPWAERPQPGGRLIPGASLSRACRCLWPLLSCRCLVREGVAVLPRGPCFGLRGCRVHVCSGHTVSRVVWTHCPAVCVRVLRRVCPGLCRPGTGGDRPGTLLPGDPSGLGHGPHCRSPGRGEVRTRRAERLAQGPLACGARRASRPLHVAGCPEPTGPWEAGSVGRLCHVRCGRGLLFIRAIGSGGSLRKRGHEGTGDGPVSELPRGLVTCSCLVALWVARATLPGAWWRAVCPGSGGGQRGSRGRAQRAAACGEVGRAGGWRSVSLTLARSPQPTHSCGQRPEAARVTGGATTAPGPEPVCALQ